jgi:hypothetical protein
VEKTYRVIQNQIALFNLVGALYYGLTGETPLIRTNINKDEWVMIRPNLSFIPSLGEPPRCFYQPEKEHDKHSRPVGISGAS